MLMDELAAMTAAYTMADDDCDGPWYWELKWTKFKPSKKI
jgi:hypothetical protein